MIGRAAGGDLGLRLPQFAPHSPNLPQSPLSARGPSVFTLRAPSVPLGRFMPTLIDKNPLTSAERSNESGLRVLEDVERAAHAPPRPA